MADNVIADPGAGGATFATDDIAGVHHPYTKMEFGDPDTATKVADALGQRVPVKVGEALPAGTNNIGDVDVLSMPALAAGSNNIGDVDVLTVPAPLSTTGGGTEAAALRVTVATDSTGVLSVDDNGGSLTVDGPVTDAQLRASAVPVSLATIPALVAGSANIGDVDVLTLPALVAGSANIGDVDIASVAAGVSIEVVGDVAADAAVPANPVIVGARASTAVPTAVSADGDSVNIWASRKGSPVVTMAPHVGLAGDPFTLLGETAQYTTAQTGTALVTPNSGKQLVVTKVQVQAGGTTAGTFQLWFGGSGDTTYTRGTDFAIFDGEFAPSATLKPGVVMDGPFIGTADFLLRVTDSAAINPLTVTVWYYEI